MSRRINERICKLMSNCFFNSLEIRLDSGITRRLSCCKTCADFVATLNFQASKLQNIRNRKTIAFTMADQLSRQRSNRFHILGYSLAFTMAEILISLTIIGIIAAITLPALQANINESAWKAQRKALYSRMSQAISMMPALNGYGTYSGSWSDDNVSVTDDTAAQAFVTDGLAKVLNINNICSIPLSTTNPTDRHKELGKCGIPDNLTTLANSKMSFPTKLSELNPMFTSTYSYGNGNIHRNPQKNIDTSAAAFETKNGESIATFYNPLCRPNREETDWKTTQPYMCANFIYDLNGRKGPNKFGKDIGFITALYPVEPELVAPVPLTKNAKSGNADTMKQTEAPAACRAQDENSRVPNRDELAAMYYNEIYLGIPIGSFSYWSGTSAPENKSWIHHFGAGDRSLIDSSQKANVRCIKR